MLCVSFENDGPKRIEGTLVNVLVDAPIEIVASDYKGDHEARGKQMQEVRHGDRRMSRWAEDNVELPVGERVLHYRLTFPSDMKSLSDRFLVHVNYSADDLYGKERVAEGWVRVEAVE